MGISGGLRGLPGASETLQGLLGGLRGASVIHGCQSFSGGLKGSLGASGSLKALQVASAAF